RERDEARAAADVATHAVTELEARHVALEAELTSLGRHAEVASALEARLATVEQERDTARANAERAAGSAAALETQLTSLQADMAEARAKAEAAAHALELAREDHDASLSALLREQ